MAKKRTRSTTAAPRTEVARSIEAEAPVKSASLAAEYHYVIRDLIQIAIIAAVLVAGLVVLSFVI